VSLDIATPLLVGFLLGSVRAIAWLVVVPPFSAKTVPAQVKVILAMGLSLPVAPKLAETAPEPTLVGMLGGAALQVAAGVSLGFLTYLLFAAVQAAGDLIDLFGGFSLAAAFDPLTNSQNSVFGRLHQMLAIVLLFMLDGHLLVIHGFLKSYDTIPLDASVPLDDMARLVTAGIGSFFLAALQIAAPLVGVLLLVDLALGLLSKIAPALNPFQIGFPAKILATLLLVGITMPLLPGAVKGVVEMGLRATGAAAGA
jgi:flagellar biosynthetic protein FliR